MTRGYSAVLALCLVLLLQGQHQLLARPEAKRAGNYIVVEERALRLSVSPLAIESAMLGGQTLFGPVFLHILTSKWEDIGSEMQPLEIGLPDVTDEGDAVTVRSWCRIGTDAETAGCWRVARTVRFESGGGVQVSYEVDTVRASPDAAYIYLSVRLPPKAYRQALTVVEADSRTLYKDGVKVREESPPAGFTGEFGGVFSRPRSVQLTTPALGTWRMSAPSAIQGLGLHAWDWTYEAQWTTAPTQKGLALTFDLSAVAAVQDSAGPAADTGRSAPRESTPEDTVTPFAAPAQRIAADQRAEVCLNGDWDFLPNGTDDLPAEGAPWIRFHVPATWRDSEYELPDPGFEKPYGWTTTWRGTRTAQSGWYRLPFSVPKGWDDDRVVTLEFEGIGGSADIYLQGTCVARSESRQLPVIVPLNRLVSRQRTTVEDGSSLAALVRVRAGNNERLPGIWRDVYLRSRPRVEVRNVFVMPSVRNRRLTVRSWLANHDSVAHAVDLQVAIWLGEQRVLQLRPVSVELERGAVVGVETSAPWHDPVLWGFEPYGQPVLYTCHVDVREGDAVLDARDDRFGFREFWTDGREFVLNGGTLFLKGDLIGPSWDVARNRWLVTLFYAAQRAANVNFIRMHSHHDFSHSLWLDVGDELGMLVEPQSYLRRDTPERHPLLMREWRHFVQRHWNHPCIVMWSSDNEACSQATGLASDDVFTKLNDVHSLVRELDPTRPVESQGNVQLGVAAKLGLFDHLEVYNAHPYGTPLGWALKQLMIRYECPPNVPVHVGEVYAGSHDPFNWWTRPAEMLRRREAIAQSYDSCGRFYHDSVLSVAEAGARGVSLCAGSGNLYWGPTRSGEFRLGPWHDLIRQTDESFDKVVRGDGKIVGRAINTVHTRIKWPSRSGVGARPDFSPAYLGHTGRGLAHNFWDSARPAYVTNVAHDWVRKVYAEVDGHAAGPLAKRRAPEIVATLHVRGTPVPGAYVFARKLGSTWRHQVGAMTDSAGTAWLALPESGEYEVESWSGGAWLRHRLQAVAPPLTTEPGYGHITWIDLADPVSAHLRAQLEAPTETVVCERAETRVPGPEELAPPPVGVGPHRPDADGFLRTFLVCGPFPNVGDRESGFEGLRADWLVGQGGESRIRPSKGMKHTVIFPPNPNWKEGQAEVTWVGAQSGKPLFGLEGLLLPERGIGVSPPQNVVGYAACALLSSRDEAATLAVGSDDGHKAWLNGTCVGEYPAHGGARKDAQRYPVRLRRGENHLLVKVDQSFGGYGFYLRFLRGDAPVTDIITYLVPHPLLLGPRALSRGGAAHPALSPDSETLAFSNVQDGEQVVCTLRVMGDDGAGNAVPKTICTGFDPAWVEAGKGLVFCRATGGGIQLWRVGSGEGQARQLTRLAGDCLEPVASPDGGDVYFTFRAQAEGGLRLLDLATGEVRNVTNGDERQAAPSPDGKCIAFVSASGPDTSCLMVLDLATGERRRLTKGGGTQGGAAFPAWSTDGERIAFAWTSIQPQADIHVIRPDGTGRQPVTTDHQDNTQPCWALDGKRLVVISRRDTGNREAWLLPY